LLSTIGRAPFLCRADAIAIEPVGCASFLVDTFVVNIHNDTLVVVSQQSARQMDWAMTRSNEHGQSKDWSPSVAGRQSRKRGLERRILATLPHGSSQELRREGTRPMPVGREPPTADEGHAETQPRDRPSSVAAIPGKGPAHISSSQLLDPAGQQANDPAGQQANDAATAGVIARPPLLFLAALLLGFALDRLLSLPVTLPGGDLVHWTVAGSLILIGLALAAAGIRNFSRAATPVPTNEPTRALVTTGIHGWSRNPIYLGCFSSTAALA
jgi:hypothetical protein